ncbi:hypothetical protein [Bradyrhizobium lablabi]|uniref:hypothetical protein n=1 Tax=Bradyrhizobium lablabi TaxID=722472 RepID=UPI0012E3A548|nr:hypothetical protein [Bradyrhizobium lablabi]
MHYMSGSRRRSSNLNRHIGEIADWLSGGISCQVNLFVSSNAEAWNGEPWQIEFSRCVREYTENAITERFGPLISKRLPRMFTTADLFIAFDPHTGKSNPEVDVVALVDIALAKSGTGTVGADELHEDSGWPLRRFNPRSLTWSRRSTMSEFWVARTTFRHAAF